MEDPNEKTGLGNLIEPANEALKLRTGRRKRQNLSTYLYSDKTEPNKVAKEPNKMTEPNKAPNEKHPNNPTKRQSPTKRQNPTKR